MGSSSNSDQPAVGHDPARSIREVAGTVGAGVTLLGMFAVPASIGAHAVEAGGRPRVMSAMIQADGGVLGIANAVVLILGVVLALVVSGALIEARSGSWRGGERTRSRALQVFWVGAVLAAVGVTILGAGGSRLVFGGLAFVFGAVSMAGAIRAADLDAQADPDDQPNAFAVLALFLFGAVLVGSWAAVVFPRWPAETITYCPMVASDDPTELECGSPIERTVKVLEVSDGWVLVVEDHQLSYLGLDEIVGREFAGQGD